MTGWASEWATLSPWVPALIVVLALAVAALAVAAVLVARRAASESTVDGGGPGAAEGLEMVYVGGCSGSVPEAIERSLRVARREMGRSGLAEAPQFLMVGETGAGKTTLLARCGLPHPFGATDAGGPLDVWLFSETAVFDPKGELMLRRDGRSNDEAGWLCLLRQLEQQRPRRPLDGLVLTIPVQRLSPALAGQAGPRASSRGGAPSDTAALQADASLRANALYERLAELQQALGMTLPVDVVITQGDHLPGWHAFTRRLDAETQKQIFGWSSPYAPEAPYQASWTDEAFDTLDDRLREAQAAMLGAGGGGGGDVGELLGFPGQIADLEPATRVYLNHLFSQSAFVDSFMLRGLYFTGGAFDPPTPADDIPGLCPTTPPTPANRRAGAPSRLLFAHDLLRAKVFPESSLGRFTEEAMQRATLDHRLAQLAALLLPLLLLAGMLFDHGRLSADAGDLARPVLQIAGDLGDPAPPPDSLVTRAGDLVAGAETVDRYLLRGLFLPPSWWSPQHGEVRHAFDAGYGGVVFPALHDQLARWQRELSAPWPPPPPGPHVAYVEATPEFEQLQAFSRQLTRFDDDVWLYDCLVAHCASGSGALTAFDRLSRDLLDVPLAPPTAAARHFYAHLLRRVDAVPFGVSDVGRAALTAQTRRLSDRLDARLFSQNPLLQDLRDLNAEIERLELDPNATAADYQQLFDGIAAIEAELARPEVAWMGQDTLEPGPAVRSTFDALAASPYVGRAAVDDLERQADRDFAAMRKEMATLSNPSTGPLLAQGDDGSAELALSTGVSDLETSLGTLLGEKFMAQEDPATPQIPGPNQRLFWSQTGLAKTTDLVTSYQSFTSDGVSPPFPQDLQATTEEVALTTLSEHMLDALAAAQSFRPPPSRVSSQTLERGLAMQVRNFTAGAPALAQILDDFQALQLYDAYDQLAAVLTEQQTHMLGDLDALLDLEPLFEPVDETFTWWRGVQPPAPPAFGLEPPAVCPPPAAGWCPSPAASSTGSSAAGSSAGTASSATSGPAPAGAAGDGCAASADTAAELASWVADETATASHLSQAYAEPILGAPTTVHLLPSRRLDLLTERWRRFVADVDQEKQKLPGNPIQSLSQLITGPMMQLTLGNCFELLPASAPPRSDYFQNRRSQLIRGLDARCRTLAGDDAGPGYRRYAKIFDERLAGRTPFALPDPATAIDSEATPAALREFYAVFDRSACLIADVPADDAGQSIFADQDRAVRTFVGEMTALRAFLAPFLDQPETYPVPTYGFRVDFRVNRSREVGADQIIDWRLRVGEEDLIMGLRTQPPPPPPSPAATSTAGAAPTSTAATALGGEWIFGEPSVLSLRWADDAPARPVSPPVSDRARLDDRTVIWDYRNLWSLLSLVRDYPATATDLPGTRDPQPETLRMEVGTRHAAGAETDAVVFNRITFFTPDFSTELDLPPFPVAAPRLTEPAFGASVSGLTVTFTNQTRGRYDTLLWSFGDGAESRLESPVHTYTAAGAYDVTLRAVTDGVAEATSRRLQVGGDAPVASFTAQPDGLEVRFEDTSRPAATAWSWAFGDGGTSTRQNPTHRYTAGGTYDVVLEAANVDGRGTAKETVTVAPSDRPEARFTALPEGGHFVRFIDESKGEITSRTWDFGDGATSTDKNPGHLYDSAGDYDVRLIVRGPGGETETIGRVTVR